MPVTNANTGQGPTSLPSNMIQLNSGQVMVLPYGWWELALGKYTVEQRYDPITGIWRTIGAGGSGGSISHRFSDGQNFRLANQTGCAVGANLTTAGSGYTSVPTVTPSAGGSIWRAIVGGALNTSVTIVAGGTNYTYPPIMLIQAPPPGGVQATGYCTISAGAVNAITLTDQGAGYLTPPTVQFLNDPREGLNGIASGSGAVAATALTGGGTVTAVLCIDHGQGGLTSVPTLTFAGGGGSSAAATAIMCWSITAYAVTGGGTVYSGTVLVTPVATALAASAYVNPSTQSGLVRGRSGQILAALSSGVITATGQVVNDGGVYPSAPTQMTQYNTPPATAASLTFTMGGQTDISYVSPA